MRPGCPARSRTRARNRGRAKVRAPRKARCGFQTWASTSGQPQPASRRARPASATFDPPGLTLLQANGKEGDQTVFHFHLHVVPRHAGDGVALAWPRKDPPRELLEDYAARLRQALAAGRS